MPYTALGALDKGILVELAGLDVTQRLSPALVIRRLRKARGSNTTTLLTTGY